MVLRSQPGVQSQPTLTASTVVEFLTRSKDGVLDPRFAKKTFPRALSRSENVVRTTVVEPVSRHFLVQNRRFHVDDYGQKRRADGDFRIPFSVDTPSGHFDLRAVVIHSGTLNKGHYNVLVRTESTWTLHNDSVAKTVSERAATETIRKGSYMMLYAHRDEAICDDPFVKVVKGRGGEYRHYDAKNPLEGRRLQREKRPSSDGVISPVSSKQTIAGMGELGCDFPVPPTRPDPPPPAADRPRSPATDKAPAQPAGPGMTRMIPLPIVNDRYAMPLTRPGPLVLGAERPRSPSPPKAKAPAQPAGPGITLADSVVIPPDLPLQSPPRTPCPPRKPRSPSPGMRRAASAVILHCKSKRTLSSNSPGPPSGGEDYPTSPPPLTERFPSPGMRRAASAVILHCKSKRTFL